MSILHEQINISGQNTIKVKWDDFPHFTFPWHYHREYEIVFVVKSYGKRFVGDSTEDFKENDLVFIGSNLPHYWRNDPVFYNSEEGFKVNAIIIQFPYSLFDNDNLKLPEFKNIRGLLERAERGVHFSENFVNANSKYFYRLLQTKGFERYVEFLKLLERMSTTRQYRLLASPAATKSMSTGLDSRMERILNYLSYNYTSEQKISNLASQIGMNPSAFCRYFKESTGKPVITYINEMRTGYACKLLMEHNKTISEIAFECGFNNISNFNRIFKKMIKHTPSEYQNHFGKF
jgi:AraC-like DNA-binding protein